MARPFLTHRIVRFRDGVATACDDAVATEEPLELRVGGRSVAVVMRTPGHDRELAAGFLLTEGLLARRDDLLDLIRCGPEGSTGNVLDAVLAPGVTPDWERLSRHLFTSASCGICSKAGIEALQAARPRPVRPVRPRTAVLAELPARLRAAQEAFGATGGLHGAALFSVAGELECAREDVGRHNAVDKVIGEAFLRDALPGPDRILLVSGRVSFEIVQKAGAAGLGCIAAVSAPTTAAVALAAATGQTLVGFLRGGQMNVYAGTCAD